MTHKWVTAAIVAVGMAVGTATADDGKVVPLGRYQPTETGFAAGTSTPGRADPVAATGDPADVERVHWGRFYRPYSVGFSFYRAPSFYGGYYNYYRPGFSLSYYSAPRFYHPSYYSGFYPNYGYGFGYSNFGYSNFYGYGGFCPIGLNGNLGMAATVDLAMRNQPAAPAPAPPPLPFAGSTTSQPLPAPQPAAPSSSFRYDGGPASPVPMPSGGAAPAPNAVPAPPVADDGTLQISLPARPAAGSKYQFRAYGEK